MNTETINQTSKQNDIRMWQEHVARYNACEGSMTAYCIEHNIAPKSFYRWRIKLGKTPTTILQKSKKALSSFVPVEVAKETPRVPCGLGIDPNWVAEFVLRLHRGA